MEKKKNLKFDQFVVKLSLEFDVQKIYPFQKVENISVCLWLQGKPILKNGPLNIISVHGHWRISWDLSALLLQHMENMAQHIHLAPAVISKALS